MRFTFRTTLRAVSFAGATLEGADLGDGGVEYKTPTGRGLQDLAPFFGKVGAIRVTFDNYVDPCLGSPPCLDDNVGYETLKASVERACDSLDGGSPTIAWERAALDLRNAWSNYVEYHSNAPPLVNSRPSCCRKATETTAALYDAGVVWCVSGLSQTGTVAEKVSFCPWCGAKLPEIRK